MRVIVYVEGASDKEALRTLLAPLLDSKRGRGIAVDFFESPRGDAKKTLLTKVPIKAANIILNDQRASVVAIPDLYPKNRGFPHETALELVKGVARKFDEALQGKGVTPAPRLTSRFRVFCLKYDLEVLLLASEQALKSHLGAKSFSVRWKLPVGDQNHTNPPRKIIEKLFADHGESYKPVVDAPKILRNSDYRKVAERCTQCFKPFVDFLESL